MRRVLFAAILAAAAVLAVAMTVLADSWPSGH